MIDKRSQKRSNCSFHRRQLLLHSVLSLSDQISFLLAYHMASLAVDQGGNSDGNSRRPGRPRGSKNKDKDKEKSTNSRVKQKGRIDAEAIADGSEAGQTESQQSEKADRAIWTVEETEALVNFLYKHKAASGEGNFRATTWHAATAHLNTSFPGAAPKKKIQVERKYTQGVS